LLLLLLLLLLQYPHLLHGAIAASAPIWNFFGEVGGTLVLPET
jgi:hypothetical protein